MANNLVAVLESFIKTFQALQLQKLQNGLAEFTPDPDWPSPCEYEQDGQWQWRPTLQKDHGFNSRFTNVGEALGIKIDKQYEAFFTTYFSENIQAKHPNGNLEILFPWSEDDFNRLQQNLIGHLMMKQKLKQFPTLFFALTDEDDLNIVVNNISGEVCLEYVGKEPHQVLAADLSTFLADCEPV